MELNLLDKIKLYVMSNLKTVAVVAVVAIAGIVWYKKRNSTPKRRR